MASTTTTKASKKSAATRAAVSEPTQEAIELRAYELYVARGGDQGQDLDDWLQAERELREAQGKS